MSKSTNVDEYGNELWSEEPFHPVKEFAGMGKHIARSSRSAFPDFLKIAAFLLVTVVVLLLAWGVVANLWKVASDIKANGIHFGGGGSNNNGQLVALADQVQPIAAPTATPVPTYIVAATVNSLDASATATALQIKATAAAIDAQISQQQIDLQRKQSEYLDSQKPSFWTYFIPAVLVLATLAAFGWAVAAALSRYKLAQAQANTVVTDHLGNYQGRWHNGQIITAAPGNALPANVPTSLHYAPSQSYAPHIIHKSSDTPAALAAPGGGDVVDGELVMPEQLDLYDALRLARPNTDNLEIVLGQTSKGFIIRPFGEETLHFGDIGATGSGKSSACQSDLFQLALADPDAHHVTFGFFDLEGKTSKPFRHALNTAFIADEPEKAADWLTQLENMMNERARMSGPELAAQMKWAIMLEEFLDLRDELDPDSWQRVIRLARKGRKCNMFLLCANQTFYSDEDTKIIKGQLRTRSLFAVEDRGTGNAFGFRDNQMIDQLGRWAIPGRFTTRDNGQLVFAQKPYISPDRIAAHFEGKLANARKAASTASTRFVAASHTGEQTIIEAANTFSEVATEAVYSPVDPRFEAVRKLLKARRPQSEIIETVWQVKPGGGNAYKVASNELRSILAELV